MSNSNSGHHKIPSSSSTPASSLTSTTPSSQPSSGPHSISIPDGRRNSQGEHLHSPVETWTPTFQRARTQSWSQEDFKRVQYVDVNGDGETLKGSVVDWKSGVNFSEVIEE